MALAYDEGVPTLRGGTPGFISRETLPPVGTLRYGSFGAGLADRADFAGCANARWRQIPHMPASLPSPARVARPLLVRLRQSRLGQSRLGQSRLGRFACVPLVIAVVTACGSNTEPDAVVGVVGGRTIVYGRIVDAQGAGVTDVRVTVRHHPASCAARPNESELVPTAVDGRYRAVLVATTQIGCVSVVVRPVGANGLNADSVMNLRAPFKQTEPLDSLAVNVTLRGGIQ